MGRARKFTINADGSYSYALAHGDADTNALPQGQIVSDQFTYTVVDANGATSSSTLTITITGTNEAPVAGADTNAGDAVTEQGVNPGNTAFPGDAAAAGNVLTNDTDIDVLGETKAVSAVNGLAGNVAKAGEGPYGSVTINADGSYSYALANGVADTNALAQGQIVSDQFTYTVVGANGAPSSSTLTITITGTNDAPVAVADTNAGDVVTEQGVNPGNTAFPGDAAAAGNVLTNDTDVDVLGETKAVSAVNGLAGNVAKAVEGTYGSVTINADGSYSYALANGDADTNALAQGQIVSDQFTYTVVDANGATSSSTLTITITGTNDAPVITAEDLVGAVAEQGPPVGNLPDSGTIAFTDVDLSDVHGVSATGTYTGTGTALGSLTATVPAHTPGTGPGGVVTWNYSGPASAAEYLGDGDSKVETFDVAFTDNNGFTVTKTISVTITGTNDAPVITAEDLVGAVTEQVTPVGNLTDSGTIAFTDVDLSDVHLVSATGTPVGTTLGSLTAVKNSDTTGSGAGGQLTWTYTVADSAVEYLAKDQTRLESFTIT